MVSVDPLGGLSLLLGRLDFSHFWHGIDASLAGRWSIGSWPFLFLLPGGRPRPAGLVLLHLQSIARLRERCEAGHSARLPRLRRPERMGFFRSIGSGLSSIPKGLMEARLLEGSALHVYGMESTQVLLIDGRSNQGHFSFFF